MQFIKDTLRHIIAFFLRLLGSIFLRLKVEGLDSIPRTGAIILVGNHVNSFDPLLAYALAPRYVKGLTAAKNFRNPLYRVLAWIVDAIPVVRGTPDLSALAACIEALKIGQALYVAPEGTRSWDGKLQKGKAGITLILSRAGTHIPIYPVVFSGLEHIMDKLKRLRRPPVHIVVGKPFVVSTPRGKLRKVREQVVDEIMEQIAALLPPQNRGVYADQVGHEPQYLEFI